MALRLTAACAALAILTLPAGELKAQQSAPPIPGSVAAWAGVNARAIDMTALRAFVGNARVIGLGEARHGVREFFLFRNKMLEYAVSSLGVTAIAAESGYNESISVDDYISGRVDLTPAIVASVFSWSSPAAYRYNEALLKWLRSYNDRNPRRKIHFYGIDLTGGRDGNFTESRAAIDDALNYVQRVEPPAAAALRARLASLEPDFSSTAYKTLADDRQVAFTAAIEDMVSLFERRAVSWSARTSEHEFATAYRSAIVARDLNANFRAAAAESNPQAQREAAMAKQLAWALQQEGPRARILLYEASWHISKGPMATDAFTSGLGEYLHAALRNDYVAIATSYGQIDDPGAQAPDPSGMAAVLSSVCRAACWIDLRKTPAAGPVSSWMEAMRAVQGGRPDKMIVRRSFDAIVFFPHVHVAQPT